MDNNHPYYGNNPQNPNNSQNSYFRPYQNIPQNTNNPKNPNIIQNSYSNPQFDLNFINTLEFKIMMRQYIAQNQNNIQSSNFINHQTTSNLGNNQPILFQSQNQDKSPSTP